MKYIKTFETGVFSEDIGYPQVYKPSNINNYISSILNKMKYKLDDCVKIDDNNIRFKYNNNVLGYIYVIKEINLVDPTNRYKISKITKDIFYHKAKFIFTDDALWVNEDHIKIVTPEEVDNYFMLQDVKKYNL